MGTPNYMSPEQVQGLAVDGRADQFGLAVIAYELLTGEKPFSGEYLPTLLYKIVREEPVAPQRINPSLSPAFETVLLKALAKDPQARYATCIEFVNALVEACESTPNWNPLPRGSSHSMPTMAGQAAVVPGGARALGGGAGGSAALAARRAQRESGSDHNPLIRSLVWVLIGIGLVGLVLLGAQKFLFNPPAVSTADQQTTAPAAATQTAAVDKPSPSKPAEPAAALPGDTESGSQEPDVTAKTETPKPEPAKAEVKEERRAVPAAKPVSTRETEPIVPARAEGERSVQLLTDPPGALIAVDGNPSTSCRTPCILSVPQGRHTLTTQLDGYRPYPRIFNLPGESDLFLKLSKAQGTLSITSTPPGASIQINGEQKPQATPATFVVPPGTYHVRVARNGVPLDFDVQVRDEDILTKLVRFP